jgi:hypothetical protein
MPRNYSQELSLIVCQLKLNLRYSFLHPPVSGVCVAANCQPRWLWIYLSRIPLSIPLHGCIQEPCCPKSAPNRLQSAKHQQNNTSMVIMKMSKDNCLHIFNSISSLGDCCRKTLFFGVFDRRETSYAAIPPAYINRAIQVSYLFNIYYSSRIKSYQSIFWMIYEYCDNGKSAVCRGSFFEVNLCAFA